MKKVVSISMLVAAILVASPGCKKNKDSVSSGTLDTQASLLIYQAFGQVFSQVQYTPSASLKEGINQTVNGPFGGHAVLTGTVTYDEVTGRVNWFLTFGWYSYRIVAGETDVTINGQMTYTGFTNSAGTMSAHFSSPLLTMRGTISGEQINHDWNYKFDLNVSNGHGSISGEMDGRSFSVTF